MLKWLRRSRQWFRPQPAAEGLTVIEYEGRAAYARAQEQPEYCLQRESESGCRFWSAVVVEVARRTRTMIATKVNELPR